MAFVFRMVLLIIFMPAAAQTGNASSDLQPAVVTLVAYDAGGKVLRQGVGVFIDGEGKAMASSDLFEGAGRFEIKTWDGGTYPVDTLLVQDTNARLMAFSAKVPKGKYKPVTVSKTVPGSKERVTIATLGAGGGPSFVEGAVVGSTESNVWTHLDIQASLPATASGSPVFSAKGELIGLVSSVSEGDGRVEVRAGGRMPNVVTGILRSKPQPMPVSDTATFSDEGNPKAVNKLAPAYPPQAKEKGISGTVDVEVLLDVKGNVIQAGVKSARLKRPMNVPEDEAVKLSESLKRAAVDAARQWKFEPTIVRGTPVRVIGTITFNFNM